MSRIRGASQPALREGEVLPQLPLTLSADAELVVDHAGTRIRLFGPARAAFGSDGVCLLGYGVFALMRTARGPVAREGLAGPRALGGRLALPDRVVEVAGGGIVVGRAGAGGSEVEVLSGAARLDPPGRVLAAGQRLAAQAAGRVARVARSGRLEEHLAALRSVTDSPGAAIEEHSAKARLADGLARLARGREVRADPGADALSRRRDLAAQAAERIRARAALADALDIYRAWSLRTPGLRDQALIRRATARLEGQTP